MKKHFANIYVTINRNSENLHPNYKHRAEFYNERHRVLAIEFVGRTLDISFNHTIVGLKFEDIDEIYLEEEGDLATVYFRKVSEV